MKILQVVQGLQKASGVTTFVENLTSELRSLGHEVFICTEPDWYGAKRWKDWECDLVHVHGLWAPFLHRMKSLARRHGVPIVWSTHGMTAPWSLRHKWWKKWLAWKIYQRRDLLQADYVHCTVTKERDWNRSVGIKRCFIAPLGTVVPPGSCSVPMNKASHILLFVGRIYPVKALDNLIRAFQNSHHFGWRLRIVGPDQAGHKDDLLKISGPDVEFTGPKFAKELAAEYEQCDALALVSHTENFGATVIDAMAYGKPVLTSTQTPWREVISEHCGWWVDNDIKTLTKALGELFAMSDVQRCELGQHGRALVIRKYSWQAIARQVATWYAKIIEKRA